ncbi:MAG: GIY-YIG nuclease family protein [Candidatus Lindowbacteria bacterium]|nr:GIY-YIG nuclease family protein [Candidatus Lindowbacteria bacterium]
MIIRAYGLYWNPDTVDWGVPGQQNKGMLTGTFKNARGKKIETDIWDQRGIYCLYKEFRLIYVGKAFRQSLGKRLRDHLADRFAGRWDGFSWFGTDTIEENGALKKHQRKKISIETLIDALEAILIGINEPPLNRRHEKLPQARLIQQVCRTGTGTISQRLTQIDSKLDTLIKRKKK